MQLDTETMRRLRDALQREGARLSMLPPDPELLRLPMAANPELVAVIDRLAPICEVAFLVMAADGDVSEPEREAVRGALRMLSDGRLRSVTIDALQALFERRLQESGCAARLQHVAAQLSSDRSDARAALTIAAAVAISDGEVVPTERALLEELSEWLGFGEAALAELLGSA